MTTDTPRAPVRLRLPELLGDAGMTVPALVAALRERGIGKSMAYELAGGRWECLKREHIGALCAVFGVPPEVLFTDEPAPEPAPGAPPKRGRPPTRAARKQ